jgi:hypothetical protein
MPPGSRIPKVYGLSVLAAKRIEEHEPFRIGEDLADLRVETVVDEVPALARGGAGRGAGGGDGCHIAVTVA